MQEVPFFDRDTEQVEGMIHRGEAFAHVEDAIDAARLSQHHKAALWLLAWSLRTQTSNAATPG